MASSSTSTTTTNTNGKGSNDVLSKNPEIKEIVYGLPNGNNSNSIANGGFHRHKTDMDARPFHHQQQRPDYHYHYQQQQQHQQHESYQAHDRSRSRDSSVHRPPNGDRFDRPPIHHSSTHRSSSRSSRSNGNAAILPPPPAKWIPPEVIQKRNEAMTAPAINGRIKYNEGLEVVPIREVVELVKVEICRNCGQPRKYMNSCKSICSDYIHKYLGVKGAEGCRFLDSCHYSHRPDFFGRVVKIHFARAKYINGVVVGYSFDKRNMPCFEVEFRQPLNVPERDPVFFHLFDRNPISQLVESVVESSTPAPVALPPPPPTSQEEEGEQQEERRGRSRRKKSKSPSTSRSPSKKNDDNDDKGSRSSSSSPEKKSTKKDDDEEKSEADENNKSKSASRRSPSPTKETKKRTRSESPPIKKRVRSESPSNQDVIFDNNQSIYGMSKRYIYRVYPPDISGYYMREEDYADRPEYITKNL